MNARQIKAHLALQRALECVVALTPSDAPPAWMTQVDALRAVIADVKDQVTEQDANARAGRGARDAQMAAVRTLRDFHLVPLRELANTLADEVEAIEIGFRLPDVGVPVVELLGKARAIAKDAARHAEHFVALGRPADFIQQMEGAIAMVDQLGKTRIMHNRSRVGATIGIQLALRQGRKIITRIGVLVRDIFRDDSVALHSWERATHVGRRGHATTPATEDVMVSQPGGWGGLAVVRGDQRDSTAADRDIGGRKTAAPKQKGSRKAAQV